MEEYPYTEVVDGKEYTYINMGTYYVTNLETGDRRLVQREVPFLFGDEYDTGVGDEDDTDLIYVDSNWYAIGSNGTKRLLLQNTASTFDQSNKILDLPDYSRQVIKINT